MHLLSCFVEIMAYVSYFLKRAAVKQPPFDQVKADLHRLMVQSQNKLAQTSFSQEDYDLARFAVVAWVDETIMNSSWKEKGKWQKELLQRVYYQLSNAGDLFFERLNNIGPHQRDVREVYYLCLALGFSGRYCNPGDEFLLEQLKTSNLKLLMGSSVGIPSLDVDSLFPEAYPSESGIIPPPKNIGFFSTVTMVALGLPVVFFVGLLLIYFFILDSIGEKILSMVP
ncbi:MAG: DotU family type IV/VI secretion system protein [Desulfobacteraceae bacterium]|nr:MAG: DotU family type IV/VI secretion system protein [Desulfobacteraceae bacterium]